MNSSRNANPLPIIVGLSPTVKHFLPKRCRVEHPLREFGRGVAHAYQLFVFSQNRIPPYELNHQSCFFDVARMNKIISFVDGAFPGQIQILQLQRNATLIPREVNGGVETAAQVITASQRRDEGV